MDPQRVLVALGGNAIAGRRGAGPDAQRAAVEEAATELADLVAAGHRVLITHGNGPQVGNLLVKNDLARDVVPPVPLDWCVAQTQATLGFLIVTALEAELRARGVEAVLDKDLTGALLGRTVGADCFVIATDVEAAAIRFGTPEQEWLHEITPERLRAL